MKEENVIILKDKKIDLTKLKIDFKLNKQQLELLEKVSDFLVDKENMSFSLMGYAGTGKTSVVKILLKWIDSYFGYSYDYAVSAPTHRAKVVITNLSGKKSKTLQSILGLMPNVDIEKLDHKSLKFNLTKRDAMPKNLLIIDEASMANDTLYDTVISKCSQHNTKVIFIGDKAQLKPVKQQTISKSFTDTDLQYELTKVERQKDSNPIGEFLTLTRDNINSNKLPFEFETTLNSKNEGIEFIKKSRDFIDASVEALKNVAYYTDYLHSRVVCFTNDKVDLYNKLIRNRLGFTNEYTKGEIIMAYNNVGVGEFEDGFINSCDYIIQSDVTLSYRFIGGVRLGGYDVELISTDEKSTIFQFILSNDESINSKQSYQELTDKIEEIRLAAVKAEGRKKAMYWEEFYGIKDSFLTPRPLIFEGRIIRPVDLKYGYSHTVHKSQGSTYTQIYIDYRDFEVCRDIELKNQLLYVGMSRCKEKAVLFY